MTAILAIRTGGVSYIAADSRLASEESGACDGQQKLYRVGAGVVGLANSARLGYLFERNKELFDGALTPWSFVDAMKKAITDDEWRSPDLTAEDEGFQPVTYEVEFLLATREGVYHIDSTLTPGRIMDDSFFSAGGAGLLARAAAQVLWDTSPKAREQPAWMLQRALATVTKIDSSTGKPIFVEVVK
jgi:ATP-dependent protease HslVU (ClpYQ) peptidase subunit